MNKQEFSIFAKAMKTYYPKDNLLPTPEAMELWFRALQDIPYKTAEVFLSKWVATEKWSPTIADIRRGSVEIVDEPVKDWGEGYSELMRAISRYGYMNEERGLRSLSPITRATAERLGWKTICCSENQMADRANFRQVYEILSKRETEQRQVPAAILAQIESIHSEALSIGGYAHGPLELE